MSKREDFFRHINEGYATKGEAIILGGAMLDGEPLADAFIKVPLKTLNRHGLISRRYRNRQDKDPAGHFRAAVGIRHTSSCDGRQG